VSVYKIYKDYTPFVKRLLHKKFWEFARETPCRKQLLSALMICWQPEVLKMSANSPQTDIGVVGFEPSTT
jgi:hypothetical protein